MAEGMATPHRAGKLKFKRSPGAVPRGRHPPCSGAVPRRPWPRSHPRRRIYNAYLTPRCSPVPPPAPPRQIKAAGGGRAGSASRSPPGEGAGSRARTGASRGGRAGRDGGAEFPGEPLQRGGGSLAPQPWGKTAAAAGAAERRCRPGRGSQPGAPGPSSAAGPPPPWRGGASAWRVIDSPCRGDTRAPRAARVLPARPLAAGRAASVTAAPPPRAPRAPAPVGAGGRAGRARGPRALGQAGVATSQQRAESRGSPAALPRRASPGARGELEGSSGRLWAAFGQPLSVSRRGAGRPASPHSLTSGPSQSARRPAASSQSASSGSSQSQTRAPPPFHAPPPW